MGKKSPKESGSELFESHFSRVYAERWPALKLALAQPSEPVDAIEGLEKPYFLDRASVVAALALNVRPGDVVLDLCAAPGGKTLVLARSLAGSGALVSNDRSADRRGRLKKVVAEHLSDVDRRIVTVTGHDASKWGLYERERYDKILLDAPCSSERHVLQSRQHLSEWTVSRTKRLAIQSMAMLCAALDALKPGGTLVYSTCSISPDENEDLVERFSAKRPEQWEEILPVPPIGERKKKGQILLPDREDGIGPLYFCVILKRTL